VSAPINLNRARKSRAKTAKRLQADENAVKFGRSKAKKDADAAAAHKARKQLDGHKQEP
jgi:hypothetical protein